MEIFSCKGISRFYQETPTVLDVNLHLSEGEFVGLLGASGVGKTTLFNILSGVDSPDSGNVFLNGEDITGQAGHVSYMLQKDLLLPHKTVVDNVCLPLVIKGEQRDISREKAAEHFKEFGLAGYEHKYPYQLSGGMRQRAALLRTFLMGGKVTLLDEPFSALDAITKMQMQSWYTQVVARHNTTSLFITHDIDEALLLSHRIYILAGKPGRIVSVIDSLPKWPRDREYMMTLEFLEKKQEILDLIGR